MTMWHTLNDLPERVRVEAIALLNQQLADALDLHLQAKQAHWNVKGPNFIALHELFDEVEEELEEHADDIAERAVALGGTAYGTARTTAKRSRLAGDLRRQGPRCGVLGRTRCIRKVDASGDRRRGRARRRRHRRPLHRGIARRGQVALESRGT
jgi:starvation-inducible DNA-binding protein